MSLSDYVIMPAADYLDACNATREKTGGTDPIKSGEMGGLIRGISGGGGWDGVYRKQYSCSIGEHTFESADYLTSVELLQCKKIDTRAFAGSSNLKTVKIKGYEATGIYIGSEAFHSCTSLKDVDLRNCRGINTMAFDGCNALETVYIGKYSADDPPFIGDGSFAGCANLKSVIIERCSGVSNGAFADCVSLEKIKLPQCENVGMGAFAGCTSLTAVIIPGSTVCVMDFSAFYDTPILNLQGFIYVSTALYEYYRAGYSDALDAAYAEIIF